MCERVWNPKKCSSTMTRYSYSPAKKCKAMEFGGCLGNDNNFATPQECSNICTPGIPKIRSLFSFFQLLLGFNQTVIPEATA